MPKNLFQDMVRIKRIERGETNNPPEDFFESEKKEPVFQSPIEKQDRNKPKHTLWLVAVISVVFLLFALSLLFSGAKVAVNPKMQSLSLNENLSASLNSNTDVLSFDLVVISDEETANLPAGEEKEFVETAQGTALIYNAFSSFSQTLDINTRLEGSNEKIYKTKTKIVIPGINKDNNPGKIEVAIYGAEAGEEYNSTPLDFKIFGFKGTPKYTKFYGRSVGEIKGGLKGKSRQITEAEKETAVNNLKTSLQTKLFKKATDQIPSGFILFQDAFLLNIDSKNVGLVSLDGMVPVSIKGTFSGFLFNEKKLTKKIAEDTIDKYDGSEIYIPNIRELKFSLSTQTSLSDGEAVSADQIKNISFSLSGTPEVVWRVDENSLAENLLAKDKSDFNEVLSQYPNINSATLSIKPFWKKSFPEKIEDIKIIVNYPE